MMEQASSMTTAIIFSFLPHLPRRLARRDVDAIVEVAHGNPQHQAAQLRLVVMPRRLVPDGVWHRLGTVGKARHRLRQSQRRAFGVIEIWRLAPGGDRVQPFVALAGLLGVLDATVDAEPAAVDLAGAEVDEAERLRRHTAFLYHPVQTLQRLHRFGQYFGGIFHACGQHYPVSFSSWNFRERRTGWPAVTLTGRRSSSPMTKRHRGM